MTAFGVLAFVASLAAVLRLQSPCCFLRSSRPLLQVADGGQRRVMYEREEKKVRSKAVVANL